MLCINNVQSALNMLSHLTLTVMDGVSITVTPILQMKKWGTERLRREGITDICSENISVKACCSRYPGSKGALLWRPFKLKK